MLDEEAAVSAGHVAVILGLQAGDRRRRRCSGCSSERGRPAGDGPSPGAATRPLGAGELTYRYGDVIGVSSLSLDVSEGRRLAILGPNGSGKTTLLLHLNGTPPAAVGARS